MSYARKLLPLFVLVILSLLASACSALNASPTPSLQELQMTAQAAAAATLTAQAPKETPVTPSPTPLPPTPIPVIVTLEPVVEVIPTQPPVVVQPQPVQPVVVAQSAATEEKTELDCTGYISAGTEGPRVPVSIINKKGASITLSYYLEPTPHGQCGSGSVNLSGDSKTLNLPVGCYWLYAWVTYEGKDQSFQGYSCLSKKSNISWLIFPDRLEEVKN